MMCCNGLVSDMSYVMAANFNISTVGGPVANSASFFVCRCLYVFVWTSLSKTQDHVTSACQIAYDDAGYRLSGGHFMAT